jgi:hypothetical protein
MVLDTQTVTADILSWSETFVEVPHPAWAVGRLARLLDKPDSIEPYKC